MRGCEAARRRQCKQMGFRPPAQHLTSAATVRMLPFMTTKPVTRFDELLSTRARIGWDAPALHRAQP